MAEFGLGFGLVTQVLTLAIQNAVDKRDLGTAAAAANFFRSKGGAVGVAIFGAVFADQLDTNVNPSSRSIRWMDQPATRLRTRIPTRRPAQPVSRKENRGGRPE